MGTGALALSMLSPRRAEAPAPAVQA
jgi:hypothetical protein